MHPSTPSERAADPKARLTVLIPTLNEAQGIRATLASLPRSGLEAAGYDVDVLIVDSASADGTADVARALGAQVLTEPRRGYGRAYKAGLAAAQGDLVVTADADATYPLDRLPEFLDAFARRGLDFATFDRLAAMEAGAMRRLHRLGNLILSLSARALHGHRLHDSQSGMWILNRKARTLLPLARLSDSMAFSQEIKIEAFRHPDLAAAELPGGYRPRVGDPKLESWRDGFGNLRALVRHRRRRRAWADGQA